MTTEAKTAALVDTIEHRLTGISEQQHALAVEKARLLDQLTPLTVAAESCGPGHGPGAGTVRQRNLAARSMKLNSHSWRGEFTLRSVQLPLRAQDPVSKDIVQLAADMPVSGLLG